MTTDMCEPTTHCGHRHADVTPQECGLCWLRLEGDAGCFRVVAAYVGGDVFALLSPPVPALYGWDACRAKHLTPGQEVARGVISMAAHGMANVEMANRAADRV